MKFLTRTSTTLKLQDITWDDVTLKPDALVRTDLLGSNADNGSTRTRYSSTESFNTDGSNLVVFVNSQLMKKDTHYTIVTSTQIEFVSSLAASDTISMLVFGSTGSASDKQGDANTLLLMHFNNSFFDNSLNVTAYPVGTAYCTSQQKKFGTHSLSVMGHSIDFFGSVDIHNPEHFDFGNNEWTIDMWINIYSLSSDAFVIGSWNESSWKSWLIYIKSDGTIWPHWSTTGSNSYNFSTSTTISTGSWKHLAVVRDNTANVIRVFIDGMECSYASSNSIAAGTTFATPSVPVRIGAQSGRSSTSYALSAYIDELRISDTARWTSNFTPPSAPYT